MRTSNRLRVALAGVVFALVWVVSPPASPPLYDGLGAPDEPYRYVSPPAGYRHTPPPTAATYSHAVTAGDGMFGLASAEQGPQVQVALQESSIALPSGASTITVEVKPLAPTTQPSDGTIATNVYRLTVRTDRGEATVHGRGNDVITLRAPSGPPPYWAIEYNSSAGWHRLVTSRVGQDIYEAQLVGTGDYAIVAPTADATSTQPGSTATTTHSGKRSLILAVGVTALVLVVFLWAVLAIRYTRLRSLTAAEEETGADPGGVDESPEPGDNKADE